MNKLLVAAAILAVVTGSIILATMYFRPELIPRVDIVAEAQSFIDAPAETAQVWLASAEAFVRKHWVAIAGTLTAVGGTFTVANYLHKIAAKGWEKTRSALQTTTTQAQTLAKTASSEVEGLKETLQDQAKTIEELQTQVEKLPQLEADLTKAKMRIESDGQIINSLKRQLEIYGVDIHQKVEEAQKIP